MKIVLANIDYRSHMSDEGDQFQRGLGAAGWKLCGAGFDGMQHVPDILTKYQPTHVVVHDKRDWDPESTISFRKDIGFTNLEALRNWPGKTYIVIKDAGTFQDYHGKFYEEVLPDGVITYYHDFSVGQCCPWLLGLPKIRTYHTIDAETCVSIPWGERKRAIVSGARGSDYPLRRRIIAHAKELGIDDLPHPQHHNQGPCTPDYLQTLAGYKVSIATASSFGFALRKIIEGVAMGCTVITDLPKYDVLPEIDDAIVRVPSDISMKDLREIIDVCEDSWRSMIRELSWAEKAWQYYDWRFMGQRLSEELE